MFKVPTATNHNPSLPGHWTNHVFYNGTMQMHCSLNSFDPLHLAQRTKNNNLEQITFYCHRLEINILQREMNNSQLITWQNPSST
jgi:hypothetical protein